MIVYKGTDGMVKPEAHECDAPGWPNRTKAGEVMHDNVYFPTIEAAWKSIWESAKAEVHITADTLQEYRARLAGAERRAADATVRMAEVLKNMPKSN